MRNAAETVERLIALAAQPESSEKLRSLLWDCFHNVGITVHQLRPTYTVIRIRVNRPGQRFIRVGDLSYPPKEFARRGRANLDGTPLFYSASCERRNELYVPSTDLEYGLAIALFETLPELREVHAIIKDEMSQQQLPDLFVPDKVKLSNIEVTYGIWETKDFVNLVRVGPAAVYDKSLIAMYIQNAIIGVQLAQNPERHRDDDLFWKYLSNEFALVDDQDNDSRYKVTGIAAEQLEKMDYHGVLYPSVRANGCGTNVALFRQTVDSLMRCVGVGRALISTKNNKLVIDVQASVRLSSPRMLFLHLYPSGA